MKEVMQRKGVAYGFARRDGQDGPRVEASGCLLHLRQHKEGEQKCAHDIDGYGAFVLLLDLPHPGCDACVCTEYIHPIQLVRRASYKILHALIAAKIEVPYRDSR